MYAVRSNWMFAAMIGFFLGYTQLDCYRIAKPLSCSKAFRYFLQS